MKGSVKQRRYKNLPKYSRLFKNPADGPYYICLSSIEFQDLVSNELVNKVDCYIMHIPNFGGSLEVTVTF